MTKRTNDHQSIKDVLKSFVTENKLEKGLDKVHVAEAWQKQMGPAIQKYTHVIRLERQTLYVSLTSSVLREELSYGKEKIIRLINEEIGKEVIKKLVLK
ncbi:DUF721 domain-containing protein [Gangjinia marincola]|uniref:DUF721 domain-containing protein n=1 Tax=Gangjinia marincola TaxID=578463 RepID=A0ABN1MIL6_9FLAO